MPSSNVPLVADMSSDIMSRTFNAEPFALIYGGVQKNMGPAGAVMYAVDIEKLGATGRDIPSYLDLSVHLGKDSMFNTPSVFSVYTTMLTLRWLKAKGGVAAIKDNEAKSALLYAEIDRNALFSGHAQTHSRSHMNVTFPLERRQPCRALRRRLECCGHQQPQRPPQCGRIPCLDVHALPLSSVEVLVDVMREFERIHG